MSILIVELCSQGLIFGADRNITTVENGIQHQNKKDSKILRWINNQALIGYVGEAGLGDNSTTTWLDKFIRFTGQIHSLKETAEHLTKLVSQEMQSHITPNEIPALIIKLGGFEKKGSSYLPFIYFITNVYGMNDLGYENIRTEFKCTEEIWTSNQLSGVNDLLELIEIRERELNLPWFHHGIDLLTFNAIDSALKSAFLELTKRHPQHHQPRTLEQWEAYLRMKILSYSSYFQAFFPKDEQYVGGGADVYSIYWPT